MAISLLILLIGALIWIALYPVMRHGFSEFQIDHFAQCGRNLDQIMSACVVYSQEGDSAWPNAYYPGQDSPHPISTDGKSARIATVRNLEVLALVESLPNTAFHCSRSPIGGPSSPPDPYHDAQGLWGASQTSTVSYAFDWSAPGDPDANRIVFADRDPTLHWGWVNICFGDGHWKRVPTEPRRLLEYRGLITESSDGHPIDRKVMVPGSKEGQGVSGTYDIYQDDPAETQAGLTPGGGSPTRAWVK
jgi:hypothetical protein